MKLSTFILALVTLFAFSSSQLSAQKLKNKRTEKITKPIAKTSMSMDGEYFGEKFVILKPIAVEKAIQKLDSKDNKTDNNNIDWSHISPIPKKA